MLDRLFPDYSLVGRVGFIALLATLALAPIIGGFPPGGAYGADVSLNALRALVCVAALCLLLAPPTRERDTPAPVNLADAPVWLAFAVTLVSLLAHTRFLTSPILLFAQLPATLDWLAYALVFTLCRRVVAHDPTRALPLVGGALLAGAAWSAVGGVWEYRQFAPQSPAHRINGPFFDPNFLAGLLALALPLALLGLCAARHRWVTAGLGLTVALTVAALAATASRAGVGIAALSGAVALLLALLTGNGPLPRRLPWARLGATLAAACLMAWGFRGPLLARADVVGGGTNASARATGGDGQAHSGAFRVWTWRGTLDMARAHPLLGTGPGTFPYLYPRYALVERTGLAHSSYLEAGRAAGLCRAVCGRRGDCLIPPDRNCRPRPPTRKQPDHRPRRAPSPLWPRRGDRCRGNTERV